MHEVIPILAIAALAGACAGQHCALSFDAFELFHTIGGQGYTITGADMDGDGAPDIVIPQHETTTQLLINDGAADPTFDGRVLSQCNSWGDFSSAVADLDDDGDLDVCTVLIGPDVDLIWYENLGGDPVEFCSHGVGGIESLACAAADLDGDGDIDIVCASGPTERTIDWYENDGQRPPTFTRRAAAPTADTPFFLYTADMEADGDADILVVTTDGALALLVNDGEPEPSFASALLAEPGSFAQIAAGDIDGDGDQDIAGTRHGDAGGAEWMENVGGQPPAFVRRTLTENDRRPRGVGVEDMDRDGHTDILIGTVDTGELWIYRNLGGSPPSFEWCAAGATVREVRDIAIADLDGDFDPDVIARSRVGHAHWFENLLCLADFDGGGGVDTGDVLAFLNAWNDLDARADVNGDGAINTLDVLAFLNLWARGCA